MLKLIHIQSAAIATLLAACSGAEPSAGSEDASARSVDAQAQSNPDAAAFDADRFIDAAMSTDALACIPEQGDCSTGATCCAGLRCILQRVCGPDDRDAGPLDTATADVPITPDASQIADSGAPDASVIDSSTTDTGPLDGPQCVGFREACDTAPCCAGFDCRQTDSGLECRRSN